MNRESLLPLSMASMAVGVCGHVLDAGHPAIRFAALVLALLVIGLAAWSISDRPGPDPLDVRIIDAAVVAVSFMALSVVLLGSFGLLGWWRLVALTGMAGVLWALIDRRTGFERRGAIQARFQSHGISALAVGLASFGVVQAVLGRIFRPPVGDPLAYHLPFAVEWLQRETLTMPVPAAGDPSPPFYPINSSAWIYWLIAPFDGEVLARFVQLPFLGLLGIGVYRLGRELDLPSPAAAMSAAIAISVPSIARSASTPENDLILAALIVVAAAYILRLGRRFSVWRAAVAAAVIGLAVGTKVIALAFGGLLGLVWLLLVVRGRRRHGPSATIGLIVAGALVVTLIGGYTYFRNAVVMGNPLYPAGYDLPGGFVLDGLYFPTWEWRQNHAFFPFDWTGFLFGMRRDFGWSITFWTIPGIVLASTVGFFGALRDRQLRRRRLAGILLIVWVGLSLLIFWYVIPYHYSRFLFATVTCAAVAGMWGLARFADLVGRWRFESWYPLLTVPIIVVNLLNVPLDLTVRERPVYWLAAALVIGGISGCLIVARTTPAPRLRVFVQTTAVAGAVLATAIWPVYVHEYRVRRIDEWRLQIQGFSKAPDAWEWLERQTAGDDYVIAVSGTNEVYPLYGVDLENRVVTIWHSGELAEYGWDEPFVQFSTPRRPDWLARIQVVGVDFIVMMENVSFGGWPVERQWMIESQDRFERVFANPDIEIWRVYDPPGEVARYTGRQGWIYQLDWQVH